MLLPLLCACGTDVIEELPDTPMENPVEDGEETPDVERLVIRAALPGEDKSRAQVQYGNQNIAAGEFFMWNEDDKITVINMTSGEKASFSISKIEGNTAEFTMNSGETLNANKGTTLVAFYGDADLNTSRDHLIFTPQSSQQVKTATPSDEDLRHLQKSLMMVAPPVTVTESDKIPDLHFEHLSSLFRVTVNNRQATELTLNKVCFTYDEIFAKSVTYSLDNEISPLNYSECAKTWESTLDSSIKLKPGESYDLFFAFPALSMTTTTMLNIKFNDDDNLAADIIGSKGIVIQPGYRYRFNMTVTDDGKLTQTSQLTEYSWYTANKDADTFTLFSVKDLSEFANLVNGTATGVDGVTGAVSFDGKTVKIADGVRELNLNNVAWTPIGNASSTPFKGSFDGNYCHISGLNVNIDTNYAGLFGIINSATVRNLSVSGSVTGQVYVGGIVGDCYNSTIENCIYSGSANSGDYVGGIVGQCSGRIIGCYTTGQVESAETNSNIGGIAGVIYSTSIERCYSMSEVTAILDAGGIVGLILDGTINECYATGAISATGSGENVAAGGIVGSNNVFVSDNVTNCIALNNIVKSTKHGGKVFGYNNNSMKGCVGYVYIEIEYEINPAVDGEIGEDTIYPGEWNKEKTYTDRGFTTDNWVFDSSDPWQYLPWNKNFENFRDLSPEYYKVKVPAHLKLK